MRRRPVWADVAAQRARATAGTAHPQPLRRAARRARMMVAQPAPLSVTARAQRPVRSRAQQVWGRAVRACASVRRQAEIAHIARATRGVPQNSLARATPHARCSGACGHALVGAHNVERPAVQQKHRRQGAATARHEACRRGSSAGERQQRQLQQHRQTPERRHAKVKAVHEAARGKRNEEPFVRSPLSDSPAAEPHH